MMQHTPTTAGISTNKDDLIAYLKRATASEFRLVIKEDKSGYIHPLGVGAKH